MSRVFVVQIPARKVRGKWVKTRDISDAERFGKLEILLPQGNITDTTEAQGTVTEKMGTYTPDDYILAIGDPIAIAIVTMMASKSSGGTVKFLKWDPRGKFYDVYAVTI